MTLFPEVRALMVQRGIGDKLLSGGGIIPPEDMETLAGQGVGRLFGPGSSTQDIAAYIRSWFAETHGMEAADAGVALTAPPVAAVTAHEAAVTPRPSPRPRKPKARATAARKAKRRSAAKPHRKAAAKPRRKAAPKPRRSVARRRR